MEQVLDVYKRPYNEDYPVVCMDESPKQLIRETKIPVPMKSEQVARQDFEYERCGISNIFMTSDNLKCWSVLLSLRVWHPTPTL